MDGSSKIKREFLINICEKIILTVNGQKRQFLKKLPQFYHKSKKLIVIHQSISQKKINFNHKKNNFFCR